MIYGSYKTVYNNSNADLTGLIQCEVMTVAEIESLLPGKHPMVAINVWCCKVTTNLMVQGNL